MNSFQAQKQSAQPIDPARSFSIYQDPFNMGAFHLYYVEPDFWELTQNACRLKYGNDCPPCIKKRYYLDNYAAKSHFGTVFLEGYIWSKTDNLSGWKPLCINQKMKLPSKNNWQFSMVERYSAELHLNVLGENEIEPQLRKIASLDVEARNKDEQTNPFSYFTAIWRVLQLAGFVPQSDFQAGAFSQTGLILAYKNDGNGYSEEYRGLRTFSKTYNATRYRP